MLSGIKLIIFYKLYAIGYNFNVNYPLPKGIGVLRLTYKSELSNFLKRVVFTYSCKFQCHLMTLNYFIVKTNGVLHTFIGY